MCVVQCRAVRRAAAALRARIALLQISRERWPTDNATLSITAFHPIDHQDQAAVDALTRPAYAATALATTLPDCFQ